MKRRSLRLSLVAVAAFVSIASVASGDTTRVQDDLAHDTSDRVDIKWVEHGHSGRNLTHTLRTYDPWPGRLLRKDNTIQLYLAPGSSRDAETRRVLVVGYRNGRLMARMRDVTSSEVVGRADLTRPDQRTVRLEFPRRFIQRGLKAYRWKVYVFQGNQDSVPSSPRDRILHRL